MKIIDVNSKVDTFCIGHQGENNATQVRFNYDELFRQTYGEGVCELLIQRPGEFDPYPVPLTVDGGYAVWTVSNTDTDKAGKSGKAEMHYYVGNTLVKTCIWMFSVMASLGTPTETPPEKFDSWLEQVVSVGSEAKQAAQEAEAAREAIENMSVSAKPIGPGEQPTVEKTEKDGVTHLEFGLPQGGSGGVDFKTDNTLILKDGVLGVNTAKEVGASTLPVTAAAVDVVVGNIEVLLGTI